MVVAGARGSTRTRCTAARGAGALQRSGEALGCSDDDSRIGSIGKRRTAHGTPHQSGHHVAASSQPQKPQSGQGLDELPASTGRRRGAVPLDAQPAWRPRCSGRAWRLVLSGGQVRCEPRWLPASRAAPSVLALAHLIPS
eukprot:scaffold976_cov122-Isochrysis_galbana.AAC.4